MGLLYQNGKVIMSRYDIMILKYNIITFRYNYRLLPLYAKALHQQIKAGTHVLQYQAMAVEHHRIQKWLCHHNGILHIQRKA